LLNTVATPLAELGENCISDAHADRDYWPDLSVAALMAGIFSSSVQILRQAWAECRDGSHAHPISAE
jgi:hypothetical protein